MILIRLLKSKHIHFFNYISVYWCNYLKTVTDEYWLGYERKRIFKLGKLTVWVRDNKKSSHLSKEMVRKALDDMRKDL